MGNDRGEEGGDAQGQDPIADALAWAEAWGLHERLGGVVVGSEV
jgi:hypothetical protein